MVFVTFHFAYWQHKHPNGDRFDMRYDTDHMMVRIYRFTGIPTQAMIDNNETSWTNEWQNGTFGKTEYYLRDNDLPVNYASLVASFFAISAFFHLWACLMGISEHCWCAVAHALPLARSHASALCAQVLVLAPTGAQT